MEWWNRTQARWVEVRAEYGRIAIGIYLTMWIMVLVAYFTAIKMGLNVEGAGEAGSALLGAWVAAKVTQPARIALTIVLTPMFARIIRSEPLPDASEEE